MALSYCPSQEAFQHSEMTTFQHPDVLKDMCFCDSCIAPNSLIDPFFNPEEFIDAENSTHFLRHFSASDPSLYFLPEIFPANEFECNHCPKRIRNHEDLFSPDFRFGLSFGASFPEPEFSPEFFLSPADLHIPLMGFPAIADGSKKSTEASPSAQSIAARQRRKKISEKTQELGKLIPGGNRLNTAEMFQAAFKYVKFLQAQVGLLELMGPTEEPRAASPSGETLHVLLSSPRMQEKLYEEEKCIFPMVLVGALAKDHELQSRPSISKDLRLLVQSMGCSFS